MERTFSFEARAVVPTTHGFTSAIPSAGSISTTATSTTKGTAARKGAIQLDPSEPKIKYEQVKIKYASDSDLRNPKRSASVPPNAARNHTNPPNNPVKLPACSTGKFNVSCRYRANEANAA